MYKMTKKTQKKKKERGSSVAQGEPILTVVTCKRSHLHARLDNQKHRPDASHKNNLKKRGKRAEKYFPNNFQNAHV